MAVPRKKAPQQLESSLSLKGSDDDLIVYCQPCDREGPRLTAHGYCINCCEHLCESCYNHHKKHTLSIDHILQDQSNMPQTLQPPPKGHSKQHDEVIKTCLKHKKETIKYYCHNHKALICHACVTLEHQFSSCSVEYTSTISDNVIDGKEYQDLLKTLQSISNSYHKMKADVNSACQKSNDSLKNVLKYFKEFRNEINQRIDDLEKQIEDKVKDIQSKNSNKLEKVEATCNDAPSSIQMSSDTIKQLNEAKQADELFIELKCAENMIKDYERESQAKPKIIEYYLEPNQTISTWLKMDSSLGTLVPTKIKKSAGIASEIKSRSVSYNGEICVKTPRDKNKCWITGMVVLTPDLLVIADSDNKAIKVVNISNKLVTDQQQLVGVPYDITTVTTDTELAVTLPDDQKIQFITATTNKLMEFNTIKVNVMVSAIIEVNLLYHS